MQNGAPVPAAAESERGLPRAKHNREMESCTRHVPQGANETETD